MEVELFGLFAGLLVSLGFVPQVIRVWRLRSAREISLPFNLLFLAGTTLWLVYGLLMGLTPVILWNGTNDVLLLLLLGAKLRYGMGAGRPPRRRKG
jgi:MtN3 and saliva related transmembrane protein